MNESEKNFFEDVLKRALRCFSERGELDLSIELILIKYIRDYYLTTPGAHKLIFRGVVVEFYVKIYRYESFKSVGITINNIYIGEK